MQIDRHLSGIFIRPERFYSQRIYAFTPGNHKLFDVKKLVPPTDPITEKFVNCRRGKYRLSRQSQRNKSFHNNLFGFTSFSEIYFPLKSFQMENDGNILIVFPSS